MLCLCCQRDLKESNARGRPPIFCCKNCRDLVVSFSTLEILLDRVEMPVEAAKKI